MNIGIQPTIKETKTTFKSIRKRIFIGLIFTEIVLYAGQLILAGAGGHCPK